MSTRDREPDGSGLSVDDAIRALLLLMPRIIGRIKRIQIPEELRSLALAPRHLSLLSYLLFDGPMTVTELADRLEVAPTTVSLLVGELSRKGVLERRDDENDRRRRIVSITETRRPVIEEWLAQGATAWRDALGPLTPDERRMFVETMRAYEGFDSAEDSSRNGPQGTRGRSRSAPSDPDPPGTA
jgi:DNA-binding MarR family transcriptional regulator